MLDAILRAAGLRSVGGRQRRAADRRGGDGPRRRTTCSRSSSPASSCTTPHSMSAESAAVLNVAEDHLDWYTGPTAMADYAADKGRIYERRAARLRLQRRRPGDRAAGPRGRRRRGRPRDRLHPRHARRRDGRRRRRRPRRPGVHRGAADAARPSSARSPTWPRRRRTSSPTRWPPPRWPAPTASRQAAVRDGLRAFRPDGHRIADGRRPSTASPGSTTPRPPTRTPPSPRCRPTTPSSGSPAGSPRAPASTTWSRAVARPAARRRAARPGPRRDRRRAFATRAGCARHRHVGGRRD